MNVLRGKHSKPEQESGVAYKLFWRHPEGGLMPFFVQDSTPYREGVDGWFHWDFRRFQRNRDAVIKALGPNTQAPGAVKQDKDRSGFCLFKHKKDAARALRWFWEGWIGVKNESGVLATVEYAGCIGEVDNILMAGSPVTLVCRAFRIIEECDGEQSNTEHAGSNRGSRGSGPDAS